MASKMEKNELIKIISDIIKRGNRAILSNRGATDTFALNRLRVAKRMLLSGKLDAIEFRDVFELENEEKAVSYSDLRHSQGASYNTIIGIRPISICCYNISNCYKGEYIYINK